MNKYQMNFFDDYQIGTYKNKKGINFHFNAEEKDNIYLELIISKKTSIKLHFDKDNFYGDACRFYITYKEIKEIIKKSNENLEDISTEDVSTEDISIKTEFFYRIIVGNKSIVDIFAKHIVGREEFGKRIDNKEIKLIKTDNIYGVVNEDFNWINDKKTNINIEDTIIYRTHVRGFSADSSSKVKHRGTFNGVKEKIKYLKDLGINMVLFMPCYEFDEMMENGKVNYWGYTKGDYFAPKNAYSSNKSIGEAQREFKDLIVKLHNAGIQVAMEFYFPEDFNESIIIEVIRYWCMNYHLDGVYLNASSNISQIVMKDTYLRSNKIFVRNDMEQYKDYYERLDIRRHIAKMNDGFIKSTKRFVKGEEDTLNDISFAMKNNHTHIGNINYITRHNTFSLYDSFSYDVKHNESNGEDNKDGENYNFSWNCGIEGDTKKKKVLELRKKMIKNCLTILLTSQGIPLIYAGDERCDTRLGNNNPYCQDNEVSWLNWNNNKLSKEVLEFTKKLINFRKQNKILRSKKEIALMDYKGLGMPDLSYHGLKPWFYDFSNVNRHFALLYSGMYNESYDIYIAFNMHWEDKTFGLPVISKDINFESFLFTDGSLLKENELNNNQSIVLKPRSIAILISCAKVNKK